MIPRILLQQIRHELRSMRNEGNHLVVRHACRTNDSDYPSQRTRMVRRGNDGKACELRIVVLVDDSVRHPTRFAASDRQLTAVYTSLVTRHLLLTVVQHC